MRKDRDNPKVREQYRKWVYPKPVKDLDKWRKSGNFQLADPGRDFNLFWPDREKRPLNVLVAGCGTSQGASHAYLNRDCHVTAIDLSESSLRYTRDLKDRHQLTNLDVVELSLFDVGTLNRKFDFIVSTGVLHHLPDPVAGGKALAEVLEPDGVMHLMLYGSTLRAGVYMLQQAFRAAGIDQSEADVGLMREMCQHLPRHHAVLPFIAQSDDWKDDAGLVDILLHPQDRAYSVPEIFEFVEQIDMQFRGWLDNGAYAAINFLLPNFPGYERLIALPLKEQATFVDNFFQMHKTHRFNLCHRSASGYEIDFDGNEWQDFSPHKRIGLRPAPSDTAAKGRLYGNATGMFWRLDRSTMSSWSRSMARRPSHNVWSGRAPAPGSCRKTPLPAPAASCPQCGRAGICISERAENRAPALCSELSSVIRVFVRRTAPRQSIRQPVPEIGAAQVGLAQGGEWEAPQRAAQRRRDCVRGDRSGCEVGDDGAGV
ncbi:class I SAM-dependent methyltransferase [Breoghania sp. L-A4]|nr:class I SAM-dependent methyltransferase [Breoghania sp. L-A4]